MSMRVTNSAAYRNYASSLNSVHSKLYKTFNKISSGSEYENAAENPLAYFEGKKMDNQYQDIETKLDLIKDVMSRLSQQETGALSIQNTLADAKKQVIYVRNDTNNSLGNGNAIVDTKKSEFLQKMQTMVNDLNAQYQDYFVYGGNDLNTAPFTLSADGKVLTYNHVFPGEEDVTTITMTLEKTGDSYGYTFAGTVGDQTLTEDQCMEKVMQAMSEKGYMDLGYGTIRETSTLLDTCTGGLNLLTGINSDKIIAGVTPEEVSERLLKSPLGLIGQTVCAIEDYENGGSKADFSETLGTLMDEMTQTEHYVSTVYSDLGNKYNILEYTQTKLNAVSDSLEEQYQDKLGVDVYQAITEMYSYQYSYQASQQLSSKVFQSSLFDYL